MVPAWHKKYSMQIRLFLFTSVIVDKAIEFMPCKIICIQSIPMKRDLSNIIFLWNMLNILFFSYRYLLWYSKKNRFQPVWYRYSIVSIPIIVSLVKSQTTWQFDAGLNIEHPMLKMLFSSHWELGRLIFFGWFIFLSWTTRSMIGLVEWCECLLAQYVLAS